MSRKCTFLVWESPRSPVLACTSEQVRSDQIRSWLDQGSGTPRGVPGNPEGSQCPFTTLPCTPSQFSRLLFDQSLCLRFLAKLTVRTLGAPEPCLIWDRFSRCGAAHGKSGWVSLTKGSFLFLGRSGALRNIRSAGASRRAASPSLWSAGALGPVPPCSPLRYGWDRSLLDRKAKGGIRGEPCSSHKAAGSSDEPVLLAWLPQGLVRVLLSRRLNPVQAGQFWVPAWCRARFCLEEWRWLHREDHAYTEKEFAERKGRGGGRARTPDALLGRGAGRGWRASRVCSGWFWMR